MVICGMVWKYRFLMAYNETDQFSYILKYFKSIRLYKEFKQRKQQILSYIWTPAHN